MNLKSQYDQIVYLLQGGGALGAYQVGVCEALLNANFDPDWVVGTSIGAINAAIIAGNTPENRIAKLKEFWNTIASPAPIFSPATDNYILREIQNFRNAQWTILVGQPGFFRPSIINPWLIFYSTPDRLSYYDTSELHTTLKKFVDFDLINRKQVRLSLGAVHAKTGAAVRFDNTHQKIGPEHVMASCALPPGFPAIKIDNEYYWDGALSSNTPFSAVLEEKTPQKLLCFIVNLFSFPEKYPHSMMEVLNSKKELAYASHHQEILNSFCDLLFLQNTIGAISKTITNNNDLNLALNSITNKSHPTSLNIARFHYKDCRSDLWSKDYNFAPQTLHHHWQTGMDDAKKALKNTAWLDPTPVNTCPIVHEF